MLFPVGFGVGLIAAAVAATASNAAAVITLGLEAVAVAFRLAIDLQRTARNIEDSGGAWARVVSGFNLEELEQRLAKVNETVRPLHRAYIGQVLPRASSCLGRPQP